MKKLTAVVIGAGGRGRTYTDIMAKTPEKFQVVGVAEPLSDRRDYIKDFHKIPEENCFDDWKPLLEKEKFADFAIISTMDRDHFAPAMAAISKGYNLMLEKPVSPEPEECVAIEKAAKEKGVKIVVCHVLRYTPLFMFLKKVISSGEIGDVISINHEECVGNVHQSHSFVRGNWGNEGRSSFMLLQKSCHDMDILQWLLDKKCIKAQSFGALTYFNEKNAPKGAPEFCLDGCPEAEKCPYNVEKLYMPSINNDWFRTAATRLPHPTDEDVLNALRTTNYGKCVYRCDNDVVDHQTVNLLFEGNTTVTFTMCAFTKGGRFIHIMGTKGEIRAQLAGDLPITVYNFETKETKEYPMSGLDGINGGHGGGDDGIVVSLYDYFAEDKKTVSTTEIDDSVSNHLIAFAAEESRRTGKIIDMDEYREELYK